MTELRYETPPAIDSPLERTNLSSWIIDDDCNSLLCDHRAQRGHALKITSNGVLQA